MQKMKDMSGEGEGEGDISLGPWGYETGEKWSFRPTTGIKQIIVRYAGFIDSVVFRGQADADYSTRFGGDGGDKTAKIDIDFPTEFLTGISGTHGQFRGYGHNICSLIFHTNKTLYGPFGSTKDHAFSVNANGTGVVTGFHGRSGRFLDAIGIYMMPLSTALNLKRVPHSDIGASCGANNTLSLPRSAGPWGGDGGRDWDDGVFAAVRGVHVRVLADTGVVSAVRFSYEAGDGSEFLSPFYGCIYSGDREMLRKTIVFGEDDEFLTGVEGFHGAVAEGINVVRSLTFVTNKGKYGPLGEEIGKYFSSLSSGDCNRKVVGFHGRSGAFLDAIGLHTQYY